MFAGGILPRVHSVGVEYTLKTLDCIVLAWLGCALAHISFLTSSFLGAVCYLTCCSTCTRKSHTSSASSPKRFRCPTKNAVLLRKGRRRTAVEFKERPLTSFPLRSTPPTLGTFAWRSPPPSWPPSPVNDDVSGDNVSSDRAESPGLCPKTRGLSPAGWPVKVSDPRLSSRSPGASPTATPEAAAVPPGPGVCSGTPGLTGESLVRLGV